MKTVKVHNWGGVISEEGEEIRKLFMLVMEEVENRIADGTNALWDIEWAIKEL